jgi:hypothetical protein
MSLINDALKRAKQAQKNQPPTGTFGPQFRPAEPTLRKSSNLNRFLPLAIFIVMAFIILLVWSLSHKNESQKLSQKTTATQIPAAPLQPAPVPENIMTPARALEPIAAAKPTVSVVSNPAPMVKETPAPLMPAPAVPKPAPPRLQAIFYNPQRPSAIIDGKTVMIGDKLGEFRVRDITQNSATLTSAAQTIVLTLE